MQTLFVLLFVSITFVPGKVDQAIIAHVTKLPVSFQTKQQCEEEKDIRLSMTKEKNLKAVCLEISK